MKFQNCLLHRGKIPPANERHRAGQHRSILLLKLLPENSPLPYSDYHKLIQKHGRPGTWALIWIRKAIERGWIIPEDPDPKPFKKPKPTKDMDRVIYPGSYMFPPMAPREKNADESLTEVVSRPTPSPSQDLPATVSDSELQTLSL